MESAIEIHVRHKEIVLNRCAKSHSRRNTGRPVKNCDRFIEVDKTSVEFITCDFHNLFQVKVKRERDQLLDYKNNSLECWKKSLKRLDKPLKRLGKTL